MKWQPKDVVALVLLVGCLVLRGLGINSIMEYIIMAVAVGYLGLRGVGQLRKPHGD